MAAIVLGVLSWIVVGLVARSVRRPLRHERIVSFPLRGAIRTGFAVLVTLLWAGSLLVGILSLVSPSLQEPGFGAPEAVGFAFLMTGAVGFFLLMLRDADIIATERGLYLFEAFLPWDHVEDLECDGWLEVRTPRLRRAWNGWSGRISMPLLAWRVTPEALDTLHGLFHRSKLAKPSE